jgi:hypothetical protein
MARKGFIAEQLSEGGSGPAPVYADTQEDKAIKNGWRLDSPPIAYPVIWPPVEEEPEE